MLEAWNVAAGDEEDCQPMSVLYLPHDSITNVAVVPREAYLLLGCDSGALRVAALLNAAGHPVGEARPVSSIRLMPYRGASQLTASAHVSTHAHSTLL